MKSSHEIDMINGPVTSKLLQFSIPLILSGILQLFYNAADVVIVGRYAGSQALAAVSATSAVISLIVNFFIGLSGGTSVALAQYLGARKFNEAQNTVHTSIALSIWFGLFLAVVGVFIAEPSLAMMNCPEDILKPATTYLKIYFLGSPANLIYNYGSAVMRTSGDTKRPLYFLTFSGIINIILNYILVVNFNMGVAGVAIATIVSQYISAILVVVTLMRNSGACKLYLKRIKITVSILGRILYLGVPASIQTLTFSFSNMIIQSSINSFGSLVIAGNGAAISIEGFAYTAIASFSSAAQIFIAQNIGAKKIKRINKILFSCITLSFFAWIITCIIYFFFKRSLMELYIPNEPEAIEFGLIRLSIILYTYFLTGTMDISNGALRAMGKSISPAIVSILCICVFRVVWVFTAFAKYRTLTCLFISYPISWLLAQIVFFIQYAFAYRKLLKENEKTEQAI